MAYNCSGGCKRVAQFSNPDVLYNGQPTGTSSGNDNTRTMNTTAATVASFRAGSTPTQPTIPAKPGSLNAAAASASTIELSWSDNSSDESGFRVERSDDGVNFAEIASLPANSSSYSDNNLAPDTLYSYRARAWNSAGISGYSNVASSATEVAPPYTEIWQSVRIPADTELALSRIPGVKDGTLESITERSDGYLKKMDFRRRTRRQVDGRRHRVNRHRRRFVYFCLLHRWQQIGKYVHREQQHLR